jgi:hypothetical protein
MSEQYDDDDLQDPFERGSGGSGAPVVSWKFVKAGGEKFVGVVLPPVVTGPKANISKGYEMKRDWQAGTDMDPDDKGWLVWPPRGNMQKIKRPVTEMKYADLWPDLDISAARKVARTNVTFHTNLTAGEFISEGTMDRMRENELDPNAETKRRIILNSRDLESKLLTAFRAIGTDRPQPGQVWTIGIEKRQPNEGRQGSTTLYSVTVTGPTEATMKIVQAHVNAEQAVAGNEGDSGDPDDPWAAGPQSTTPRVGNSVPANIRTGGASVQDIEPPF